MGVDGRGSEFVGPAGEVDGEGGDVGVGEAVCVVVLGVLLAGGGQVGGELGDGEDGSQVVP